MNGYLIYSHLLTLSLYIVILHVWFKLYLTIGLTH